MTVSIIIPAYNEAKRLPTTLTAISFWLPTAADFNLKEIIVVDDCSIDNTADLAQGFSGRLPIQVIKLPANCGKGCAVRTGILAATGDLILMYDADGATSLADLQKLVTEAKTNQVVIGSRLAGDNQIVQMSVFRRLVGLVFHWLCAPLLPRIKDASCGAKVFQREAAQAIFMAQKLDRFAFDIEILWLARRLGYSVKEVPVNWQAVPGSKVKVWRDAPEMFWSVLRLYGRQLLS